MESKLAQHKGILRHTNNDNYPDIAAETVARAESVSQTGASLQRNPQSRSSVAQLMRNLVDEAKTLIRQELNLARKEVSEKASYAGRNAAGMGAGVGIAYAGAIVLLLSFGFLIAWAIHLAGIQGLFAAFLGLMGIGLITVMLGAGLILKGVSAFKRESLAPERTLHTLQEMKGSPPPQKRKPVPRPKLPQPSSAELQSHVQDTESDIGETLEALRDRLSPRNIKLRITRRVQEHRYSVSLLAMVAGVAGGFVLRRRLHRA